MWQSVGHRLPEMFHNSRQRSDIRDTPIADAGSSQYPNQPSGNGDRPMADPAASAPDPRESPTHSGSPTLSLLLTQQATVGNPAFRLAAFSAVPAEPGCAAR